MNCLAQVSCTDEQDISFVRPSAVFLSVSYFFTFGILLLSRMTYEDFMRRYGMLLRVDNINGLSIASESPLHGVTNVCSHHSNDGSINSSCMSIGNTDAHSSPLVTSRAPSGSRPSK